MAVSFVNADVPLGTAATTILVSPATSPIVLSALSVCNTDTAAHTVNVWRVPLGGTAAVANILIDALTIAPGATVSLPLVNQALINGQTLQAAASVAALVNLSVTAWQPI